jgi:hypothetical protein
MIQRKRQNLRQRAWHYPDFNSAATSMAYGQTASTKAFSGRDRSPFGAQRNQPASPQTTPLDARYVGYPCSFRAPDEGIIERDKSSVERPAAQVQRVGEIDAVRCECKRCRHRRFILGPNVVKAEQLRESVPNRTLLKSVQAAEHPAGFEQYRFRDPNGLPREQRSRRGRLPGIVPRQQADQYVSIDRDHGVARLPAQWQLAFARASSLSALTASSPPLLPGWQWGNGPRGGAELRHWSLRS